MAAPHTAFRVSSSSKSVGKRISGSKRLIEWRFSYAEAPTHVHEVTLKHSIMSGKRVLYYDGEEIHKSSKVLSYQCWELLLLARHIFF